MAYDESFQAKVFTVLVDAFEDYLAPVYDGRMYAFVAPGTSPYPKCVYQSQDGGGRENDTIGANGWRGTILFRTIHTTLSGAMNKTIELSNVLPTLAHANYSLSTRVRNPFPLPVEKINNESVYTFGIAVEIEIHKNDP